MTKKSHLDIIFRICFIITSPTNWSICVVVGTFTTTSSKTSRYMMKTISKIVFWSIRIFVPILAINRCRIRTRESSRTSSITKTIYWAWYTTPDIFFIFTGTCSSYTPIFAIILVINWFILKIVIGSLRPIMRAIAITNWINNREKNKEKQKSNWYQFLHRKENLINSLKIEVRRRPFIWCSTNYT